MARWRARSGSCGVLRSAARHGPRRRRGLGVQPGHRARSRRADAAHQDAAAARSTAAAARRAPLRQRDHARRSAADRRLVEPARGGSRARDAPQLRRRLYAAQAPVVVRHRHRRDPWRAAADHRLGGRRAAICRPQAWTLFGIMFLWQLPHFLAIAWMYREDYARAGFPMLPVLEPDGRSTGAAVGRLRGGAGAAQSGADADAHDGPRVFRRRAGRSGSRSCG